MSRVPGLVTLALTALCCWMVAPVSAQPPAPLRSARQLLLVVTEGWDAIPGQLRRFERTGEGKPWRPVGTTVSVVVGRNGLAWDPTLNPPVHGPQKAEGDGRSPAGAFSIGKAFGYAPSAEASWLKLSYLEVVPGIECVDDATSSRYNTIVDSRGVEKRDWSSAEKMREVGDAYRWGVVVNYNTPPVPERGSCIFLHIGGQDGRGTSGCTAMAPDVLRELMAWLDPVAAPVLVQLPRDAYEAAKQAWGLP